MACGRGSMGHFALSERGNAVNEDFACSGATWGVLLDGASGLGGPRLFADDAPTDACWLSHGAGREAARLLEDGASCRQAASAAYRLAAGAYRERVAGQEDREDPSLAPSATIALACVRGDAVEVLWMGDSPVVVVLDEGIEVLRDPEVIELDARALARARELRALPGNEGRPARELVGDMLARHRALRNAPGGYRIFDPVSGDPAGAGVKTFARRDVRAVLGMSDGLMAAFEAYGMEDLEAFCRAASRERARSLVRDMRSLEAADASLERYPRFKVSDDASMFYLPVGR